MKTKKIMLFAFSVFAVHSFAFGAIQGKWTGKVYYKDDLEYEAINDCTVSIEEKSYAVVIDGPSECWMVDLNYYKPFMRGMNDYLYSRFGDRIGRVKPDGLEFFYSSKTWLLNITVRPDGQLAIDEKRYDEGTITQSNEGVLAPTPLIRRRHH